MDELDLLETAGAVAPGDPDVIAQARVALVAAIEAEGRLAQIRPRSLRGRRTGLALAGLVSTAAAVLLATGVVSLGPGSQPPAEAAAFRQLAEAAASQPPTDPPGPSQFQFTESRSDYQQCSDFDSAPVYCYNLPTDRWIWIGPDGSGRIRETFGTPVLSTPADRAAWQAHGSPNIPTSPDDTTFGPGGLSESPGDLGGLSTDPTTLTHELLFGKIEGNNPTYGGGELTEIADLLRESDASPALRTALFEVASRIKGVTVLESVRDHAGGDGIGIAWGETAPTGFLIIFDPTTAAFLEEDETNHGILTSTDWTVYLSSGVVDSLSSTPTGSVPPAPPISVTCPDGPKQPCKMSGSGPIG